MLKESFVYKYLDMPCLDQILAEIAQSDFPTNLYNFKIIDHIRILEKTPSLLNWFNENNLVIDRLAFLNQKAQTTQVLHVDSGPSELALNFPVSGCHEVKTEFYEDNGHQEEAFVPNTGLKYYRYVSDKLIFKSEYELTKPTLINIKVPHRIVNNTDHDRICYSFRFKEDPWFLAKD